MKTSEVSQFKLKRLPGYTPFPGPVVCVIMDGVGLGKQDEADGVYQAYTPVLDRLLCEEMFLQIKAHGTAVGMASDSDMGNSEVGHNALGAGRIFDQGAKLASKAIETGALFQSKAWKQVEGRGMKGGAVHFIGLLSDGNVHSHIDHLFALIDRCAERGIARVRIHALLDGRDVGERTALRYIEPLEAKLEEIDGNDRDYRIASGGGRMVVTMDRYNADWAMVERGWKIHVQGEGRGFDSASKAIETYYEENPDTGDQYLDGFVVHEDGRPVGTIEEGDAVVLFNFRGDRSIELTKAFEDDHLPHFDRGRRPEVYFAGMTQYDGDTATPKNFLVEPPQIDCTMGQYLCAMGETTFAISETQKFGHVTYFWNGNRSSYIDERLERYVEIKSDNVPFDQRPWMKAAEITDATVAAIKSGRYKFIRLNYPNGDMVGHTGVPAAIRVAVESVDLGLKRLVPAIKAAGGVLVVLADHGNADEMFTGFDTVREPMVAHTLNPVPFIVKDLSGNKQFRLRRHGEIETPGLSHVAATLFNLLGYEAPVEYDPSLIEIRI